MEHRWRFDDLGAGARCSSSGEAQGRRPLRLEATYWSGPLLCTPVPDSWILGLANIVGVPRNFQLVRERIVDVCLTGLPDCPPAGDPELTSIALSKMPVFFVVREALVNEGLTSVSA